MENQQSLSGSLFTNSCKTKPRPSYPVLHPTYTTLSVKNFKNAVDFNPKEKLPCKNTWYRDLKSTHIRNKHLLDLPFNKPKCCADIYNITLDRQKLKKLQKYGLTKSVRKRTLNYEFEEVETCVPESQAEQKQEVEERKPVIFPECYEVPESSTEEEESEYEFCDSGSVSLCSGCSTLGGGIKRKSHKVVKTNWEGLLHLPGRETCEGAVKAELRKHKLGRDFLLKLKKVF